MQMNTILYPYNALKVATTFLSGAPVAPVKWCNTRDQMDAPHPHLPVEPAYPCPDQQRRGAAVQALSTRTSCSSNGFSQRPNQGEPTDI